jgi:hypothetical protein
MAPCCEVFIIWSQGKLRPDVGFTHFRTLQGFPAPMPLFWLEGRRADEVGACRGEAGTEKWEGVLQGAERVIKKTVPG